MTKKIMATLVTVYDNGDTVLESPCKLDLMTHQIVRIGNRKVIRSPYRNSQIDDNVKILTKEYIRFRDNTTAPVKLSGKTTCFFHI